MNIINNLQWRYSTKLFDSTKKIDEQTIAEIEDGLVLTASSFGLQPWQFLIIENQDIKQQLTPASFNQPQIESCSHLIVLTAMKSIDEKYIQEFIDLTAQTRGIDAATLQGYKDMMIGFLLKSGMNIQTWSEKQCYIALGNLLNIVAEFKIDACPMEGIIPAKYDEILGLTNTNYTTCLACPIGYRSVDDSYANAKKVRFEKEKIIKKIVFNK